MSKSVKAYLGKDPYIFVSYAHADSKQVMPFIAALQKKYNVWFDEGIHYGEEWESEIVTHLENCAVFLYIITDNSLQSMNCKDEIYHARELQKPFINVLFNRDTTLTKEFKFRYGRYQMCLLYTFDSMEEAVDDLVRKSDWFESVRRTDIPETTDKTSSKTDSKYEDDAVCDSKCSDETESKVSAPSPYRREGDYIYFGEYPQTIKDDNVNITSRTDSRGYYQGSDGAYYAKVVATPYGDEYRFSTGEYLQNGATYYFKVEPIRWKMLGEKEGVAFVVCDCIIANRRYAASSNNYAKSEIRAWLNNEFYNSAFSTLQQGLIEITEVDNSARSTNPAENAKEWDDGKNKYACENTRDKIFLLSEQEVTTTAYGFSAYNEYGPTNTRCRQTTDYTRATGAYMNTDTDYYGNGWWWLSSPHYYYPFNARYVYDDGSAYNYSSVDDADGGVVPALRIRLIDKMRVETTTKSDSKSSSETENKVSTSKLYRREGDYIYFGEYPQTIKADNVNITTTTDARGYYLGSDGAYYAKVVATPFEIIFFEDKYNFSTGEIVQKGVTYYFKVEPVRWRILNESKSNRDAIILCDSIIANRRFDDDSNNYAESEIRSWLNNEFYNSAFSTLQQGLIEITEVDNSARSTNPAENATAFNDGKNEYACANTRDKIFLLSEQEVTTTAYGFSAYDEYGPTNTRCRKTTDYTRATGADMDTDTDYYGNGRWWLRSPGYNYSFDAMDVSSYGYVFNDYIVSITGNGVVPALRIKL